MSTWKSKYDIVTMETSGIDEKCVATNGYDTFYYENREDLPLIHNTSNSYYGYDPVIRLFFVCYDVI